MSDQKKPDLMDLTALVTSVLRPSGPTCLRH